MFTKILIVFLILSSQIAHAKKFTIIHTNDLHSYYDGLSEKLGSYARMKTIIDNLKEEASANDMKSIVLDGGDWGEGTSFFLTNDGVDSIKLLEMIGIDVAVIGNHDHMQGGKKLSDQIKASGVKVKFVSANLLASPQMDLKDIVKSKAVFDIDGIKVHIIGLSTAEPHHQGALIHEKGAIIPPIPVGCAMAKHAKKKEGADVVIALTHIGLLADKGLGRRCRYIDAIVGGHSHTRLEEPLYVKNLKNKVPIVQTGANTQAVGKLVLEFDEEKKKIKVVEYKLFDANEQVSKNQLIQNFVEVSKVSRNHRFNGRWDEFIGVSEIPLIGKEWKKFKGRNCWFEHMAEMVKQATDSDFGTYLGNFGGSHFEPGFITYGMLVDNFPHFRNFSDEGWELGTITAKGDTIKEVLKVLILYGNQLGLYLSGADFNSINIPSQIPWIGGYSIPIKLKQVGNLKIDKQKEYKIGIPHEIFFTAQALLPKFTEKLLPNYKKTGVFYWPMMENYVRENSPIKCLE